MSLPAPLAVGTNPDILHFSLQGLFPDEHTLVLNLLAGTVSVITVFDGHAYELYAATVTDNELPLLLVTFQAFPYYVPHEVMHAASTYHAVSDERVARSARELAAASRDGLWDQAMRPTRNVLSRARAKIRPCGLDIVSILETGYILRAHTQRGDA